MRLVFILSAFLLLALTALAGIPTTEDVTLRIKDAQQRPVVNATVTIEYTYTDPYFGELHKTDVIYSNQFGVAQKKLSADFNAPYKITIEYHDASQVIESVWTGGLDRFINLPLTDFSVKTVDSESNPIANVPLRIIVGEREFTSRTNVSGYCIFQQYNKELRYLIYARYGGKEHFIQVVPDNRLHNIQIPTYTIEVKTINDNGNAVLSEMNLTFTGVEPVTRRSAGIVGLFTQVPEGNATISLLYVSRSLNDTFYVNASTTLFYVFDLNGPNISSPTLVPVKPVPENEVQVFANITDPGRNASGMPPVTNLIPPAELYYSLDGAKWESVHMYPEANNRTYRGRIPGQPVNSVVRYYITAWDKVNNTAHSPQYTFNTFVNVTTNGGKPPGQDSSAFLAPLLQFWWVAAIVIVLAALYYIKKRYF